MSHDPIEGSHVVMIRSVERGSEWWVLFLILCFRLFTEPAPILAQDFPSKTLSIEVTGNQRIEKSAILGRVTMKVGDVVNSRVIREQIRQIYEMGFFDDVQVQTEVAPGGVHVVFFVREKQFSAEIVFDGNDKLSEDKLKEVITLRSQVFLDPQQVKVSAEKIREAYRQEGYQNAQVVPIVQALDDTKNRITFFIREGERAHIKTITFAGRRVVKKKDLLDVMANREYVPLWSLITDAGVLHREELANDVERIREVYSNRGYLDVQVSMPTIELTDDKKSFALTFNIVEGFPYTVKSISFEGNTVFEDEEFEVGLSIGPGDVFQRAAVRKEITRVTDMYGEKGYSFAEVTPSLIPDPKDLSATITFTIKEGSLIRVREIRITGNDKTRDNVIRRELRVDEQEVINSVGIKRSFERLNNLNFFETVEILPNQVADDKVDLEVKVKEKPTGSFSIGGGFSTLDQFTLIANITEGNLFGLGYMVRIRGQIGGRRTLGVLTFRNPALFDGPTSFQVDGFSTETDFLTYEESRYGGTMQWGRSLSEFLAGSITLVAEEIEIKNPSSDASQSIRDQVGTQSTTGFRASVVRDTRDNFVDPRTGLRTSIRASLGTSLLGGSNNFYSVALDALKYTPLPFWKLRWAIRGRIGGADGIGDNPVPLTELFFVGGINTVRGFQFGRAGPTTASDTPEGATKQIILNNELIFPVLPDAKLNGVLFFDYGKGFADNEDISLDLRTAAGLEVRWISPFGPLRAAWGVNLDPEPKEQETVFEFSVGNVF